MKPKKTGPRIVALGGGTGLSTLLRGLKRLTGDLTALVTVTDDGGSSGRLREELGILPPGDIRNCLVALAEDESLMGALFAHRFDSGASLAGHSFGNLFLAALTQVLGDFERAVKESGRVLNITGTVLPSTTCDVRLQAILADGRRLTGQSAIARAPAPIERVCLLPDDAEALPLALERIAEADLVVLGPGSLFTSVVPNVLVRGVSEALRATSAAVVYIANVMTQPGETDGLDACAHLDGLLRHLDEGIIDLMVVNRVPVPAVLVDRYALEGAAPVVWGEGPAVYRGVRIIPADVVEATSYVRHDPGRLASTLLELASRTA